MKDLLLASNNEHKFEEFNFALSPLGYKLHSLKEFPLFKEPDENGNSYKENALIKAKSAFLHTKMPVLADDSGIEIRALGDHFPGIHSNRYAKALGASYDISNAKILELLKNEENRNASFHCVICLFTSLEEPPLFFEGIAMGTILKAPLGKNGFGYDPIFFSSEAKISFGAASKEIKNHFSHRAKAINQLLSYLEGLNT